MLTKSNKITVYLIKDWFKKDEEILKDVTWLGKENTDWKVFYYKKSIPRVPSWIKNFFRKEKIENAISSSTSGLYVARIFYWSEEKIFAVTFGYWWQLLKSDCIVERFGLVTALNTINQETKIKKIDKKNLKNGLKDVSEQLGKIGTIQDFWFDIEQDILKSIVGEPKDVERFGKNITGKDALSLSAKVDIASIDSLLYDIYSNYSKEDYKENFWWIDRIQNVKNNILIQLLDLKLVDSIKNKSEKTWTAIPENIEWEAMDHFSYKNNYDSQKHIAYTDIVLSEWLESFESVSDLDIDINLLRRSQVYCFDTNGQIIKNWSIYKCLYSEIDHENSLYILVNGIWYEIEREYAEMINQLSVFESPVFSLPDCDVKQEKDYNQKVEKNDPSNFLCLDGWVKSSNLIKMTGRDKVEFCDLLRKDKYLVHVKHYGSSAVFSHLFNQWFVSAELMLRDSYFRWLVESKLSSNFKIISQKKTPNASEFTIVFAVISSSKKKLELPFFSKITFQNIKKTLELYKYNVLLVKINNIYK